MTRICSKLGPRYPIYNDKQCRCPGGWNLFPWYIGLTSGNYFPAPRQINFPIPRPTYQPKHHIKQPKAAMGFVHGNRTFISEE